MPTHLLRTCIPTCAAALCLSLLGSGCIILGGGGNDDAEEDTDGTGETDATASASGSATAGSGGGDVDASALDACRGGASDAQVDDTVVIVGEFNDSLHEMVVCGGLQVRICAGVIDGIIDAIIAQSNDATPDGWTYEGGGVYRTSGAGVEMTTQFYLAEDFEFGSAGDVVTENLFLVDSYLVGAVLEVDFSNGATQIVYDQPGPLVELLGFGPNPPNPLPVDVNDLNDLKAKLRNLEFEANIVVDDMRETSIIEYELVTPRQSAGALVGGEAMSYEMVDASGFRAGLDQMLEVQSWDVVFVDGGLDGTIDFTVDGQHFGYAGTMVYESSGWADPQLRCE